MSKTVLRQNYENLLMITISGYDLNDLQKYLDAEFRLIHTDRTHLIFIKVFEE